MNTLIEYLQANPGSAAAAGAAITHFSHLAWPSVKASAAALARAYPYCRDNGGIKGIIGNFFVGNKQPEIKTIAEQLPKL